MEQVGSTEIESQDESLRLLRPATEVGQRLIDATIAVIDVHGETAVRVQDIVATVGVPIPVLYREFGNREGLVQAAQVDRLTRALGGELELLAAAIQGVRDADEFATLIDLTLDQVWSEERRSMRWKRVNILGSTYGRPELTQAIAMIQRGSVSGIAEALRPAQEQGWMRQDLDLEAFAAWFAGLMIGRILIELGGTTQHDAAWNDMSRAALRHVMFG
jgi:AcrR family transcriptional regulator